jgi:hypothetical protein
MGLLGMVIALGLLIFFAYKDWSVLLLAPAAALVAAAAAREPLLAHWTQTFMGSAAQFLAQFFPLFLLGALFGKLMDDSGSVKAIASTMSKGLGARRSGACSGASDDGEPQRLIIDARVTAANGTAERTAALDMVEDNAKPRSTVGGDKNYDTAGFVAGCRERGCTPHVSQNDSNRRSAIDARTTRHLGYRLSMIKRKQIEEPFGWMKTVGGLRKTRHCGRRLIEWFFVLTATAYNLVRIPKILVATG